MRRVVFLLVVMAAITLCLNLPSSAQESEDEKLTKLIEEINGNISQYFSITEYKQEYVYMPHIDIPVGVKVDITLQHSLPFVGGQIHAPRIVQKIGDNSMVLYSSDELSQRDLNDSSIKLVYSFYTKRGGMYQNEYPYAGQMLGNIVSISPRGSITFNALSDCPDLDESIPLTNTWRYSKYDYSKVMWIELDLSPLFDEKIRQKSDLLSRHDQVQEMCQKIQPPLFQNEYYEEKAPKEGSPSPFWSFNLKR